LYHKKETIRKQINKKKKANMKLIKTRMALYRNLRIDP